MLTSSLEEIILFILFTWIIIKNERRIYICRNKDIYILSVFNFFK